GATTQTTGKGGGNSNKGKRANVSPKWCMYAPTTPHYSNALPQTMSAAMVRIPCKHHAHVCFFMHCNTPNLPNV
ncbi:MAG: hypothetical protein MUF24_06545, partial [Chitinophagaceae bacterium]|nr:hypothetical protein [Chitinophagaceae bacterium]